MSKMPFIDFLGKRVLVTGASSGMGKAIAIELSKHNTELILMGRNEERLDETGRSLISDNYQIIKFDLNDHSEILPRVKKFVEANGKIYGLCHSAGIDMTRPLGSYKPELFQSILDINLIAGIELSRCVGRRDILDEIGGSFLFISSIAGIVGVPGRVGYSASKGGISAAVRSMAIELARRNIRVNAISPGLVRTSMTDGTLAKLSEQQIQEIERAHPLGIGAPEDIARTAAFIMAPQSKWITGVDMIVDGGYTVQ